MAEYVEDEDGWIKVEISLGRREDLERELDENDSHMSVDKLIERTVGNLYNEVQWAMRDAIVYGEDWDDDEDE